MLDSLAFVVFLVAVALVFDFINGFHDSANSIATIVSTQVLPPKYAVIWAAFFNFAAVFFIGVPVAKTIGTGIIHPDIIDNLLIFSALGAAIIWNLITWYFGLPSSSSHALIGGLIGAGMGETGPQFDAAIIVRAGKDSAKLVDMTEKLLTLAGIGPDSAEEVTVGEMKFKTVAGFPIPLRWGTAREFFIISVGVGFVDADPEQGGKGAWGDVKEGVVVGVDSP